MKIKTILAVLAVFIVSIAVLIPQRYLALHPGPNLDWMDFVWAVVIPIALATVFFGLLKQRILLFAFLAYIWSFTDDAPVYLDSVFTWPEVTSGLQHTFLEILLHILTIIFLYLAVREAIKGTQSSAQKTTMVYILAATAFVFAYAQNIPLNIIREWTAHSWYRFDIVEHLISLGFFSLAILIARRKEKPPYLQRGTGDPAKRNGVIPTSGLSRQISKLRDLYSEKSLH